VSDSEVVEGRGRLPAGAFTEWAGGGYSR